MSLPSPIILVLTSCEKPAQICTSIKGRALLALGHAHKGGTSTTNAMASNGAIPEEEETENTESQRTELEMLQSIYTNKELIILKADSEYLVHGNSNL